MKATAALCLAALFVFVSCAYSGGDREESSRHFNPLKAVVDFYQGPLNRCAAVRSSECPMYPSCSEYSRQALEKYGSMIGAMMVADRLMRCGQDEISLSPIVHVNGKLRFYDPLENNTFWWDKNIEVATKKIDS